MTAETRRDHLKGLVSGEGVRFATTPILLPTAPYFDLAGEEFGARLILAVGADGSEFCLRPDFTLPIAMSHIAAGAATPAAYGYLGPIFRQRSDGPAEFDQAGLEFLAHPDAEAAFAGVLDFARAALALYGARETRLRFGSVALFEALLAECDMPEVWRPRIRARFGHPEALERLLDRLAAPQAPTAGPQGMKREEIEDWVAELMLTNGLSVNEGRSPGEIVERYLEKQALDAAQVPAKTIALLRAYLALAGEAGPTLDAVETLARENGIALSDALEAARARADQLRAGNGNIVFDAGFSPRLDYYTGVVFEITDRDGAVLASGGQYDLLLTRLGAEGEVPAVGCAVWVDRLEAEARR